MTLTLVCGVFILYSSELLQFLNRIEYRDSVWYMLISKSVHLVGNPRYGKGTKQGE